MTFQSRPQSLPQSCHPEYTNQHALFQWQLMGTQSHTLLRESDLESEGGKETNNSKCWLFFWRRQWLCQFAKCNSACQNPDKKRLQNGADSQFCWSTEKHFAVTLSTVSPLAKEMPFTGTLKIIKHIMDITVTLWLVCSFVWVWLLQLRPY